MLTFIQSRKTEKRQVTEKVSSKEATTMNKHNLKHTQHQGADGSPGKEQRSIIRKGYGPIICKPGSLTV